MEQAGAYLRSSVSKPQTNGQDASGVKVKPSTVLPNAWIERIWERMTAMYGHRWVSAHGERDDGTWSAGLGDVTGDEIAHGLSACLSREDPWPPSLPEFRAMCKPPVIRPEHRIVQPQLPPPRNPEKASEAVARMREALK